MSFFWFFRAQRHLSNAHHQAANVARFGNLSAIVWIVFGVLGTFVAWANWATLDQITRAPGSVIASSRTQIIQSQEGGTIKDLLVKEGDTVEAGELLLQFDRTRFETGFLEFRAKAAGLLATVARLQAEVLGTQLQFPKELGQYPEFKKNQTMLFTKRQSAINEEIAALDSMIDLVNQELQMNEPLLASGDVSRSDILRLKRQLVELKSQATNKRNKYFQDAQAELGKAQEELAGVQQSLAQRKNQLDLTELRAPVRGVVKNVRITTLGGVIRPGEEVMQIVPLEDDLVIHAKVSPADIAFLRPGQYVAVKIDAYDFTVYGELAGKLDFISADTMSDDLRQGEQPYFRAQVLTEGRQFSGRPNENLEIQPGMTATIEVKTGQRTVMQYLTKPVIKTLSQSLGER